MISFNWDIHLKCNYDCSYCWWHGKDEEKKIIVLSIGHRGFQKFAMESVVYKGKKCNAGRKYGVIFPNGNVKRCGGFSDRQDSFIGNIFNKEFTLLDKSTICDFDRCVCNEWAFLLEKEEDK